MATDETPTDIPCSACRGTGTVISNLGGERSELPCPWCEGRGVRLGPEHNAQDFAPPKPPRDETPPPDQAA
jgi:DnaJ-class molecular chaperone